MDFLKKLNCFKNQTLIFENLESLHFRLISNRRSLKMGKTVFIEIGNEKSKTRSIYIGSHPIDKVDVVKYMRIRLDSKLQCFEKHVDLVVKKLMGLLGLLKIIRQELKLENHLLYYRNSIEPIISYALIFYGSTNRNNRQTVFFVFLENSFSSNLVYCSNNRFFERFHELYDSALL